MQCELLPRCGFFKNYCQAKKVAEWFAVIYCNDMDKSEECARKKHFKEHGSPPVDNMSPTGEML